MYISWANAISMLRHYSPRHIKCKYYFTCNDLRFTNRKENGNWSDYFNMIFSEMLMPNYYCNEGFKYIITDDHKQWFAFPSFAEMSPKIDEVSWSFYNNYSGSLQCNCTAKLPAISGHTIITKLYTEKPNCFLAEFCFNR